MSAETLALHREGAVSGREAADIRAHLAVCPQCSAVDAQLADLPRLFGAATTAPMPPTILVRIQMAISSESAARGAASNADGADTARASDHDAIPRLAAEPVAAGIPGRPDLPARRRRRFPRFGMPDWSSPLILRGLAATAAIALIVGAGMMLANSQTASTSSGTASGPARSPSSRPTAHGAPANRPLAEGPIGISYRTRGQVATTRAVVSTANYTRQSLPGEVRRDVASSPAMNSSGAGAAPQTSVSPIRLPGPLNIPQMEGCLSAVATGRMVVVAEIARYIGTPAVIIMLRAGGSRVLDVVIAGFACSASNTDIITTLKVPTG